MRLNNELNYLEEAQWKVENVRPTIMIILDEHDYLTTRLLTMMVTAAMTRTQAIGHGKLKVTSE